MTLTSHSGSISLKFVWVIIAIQLTHLYCTQEMIAFHYKCVPGTFLLDRELNEYLKSLMKLLILEIKYLIRIPFVDPKKLKLFNLAGEYHSKSKSITISFAMTV